MEKQVVAITGAAGNLGSILAEGFLSDDVELHLLWHKKPLSDSLLASEKVKPFQVDLSETNTIVDSLKGVDTVIHFAGILFMGNPEKFLPTTNTQYFSNLLQAAKTAGVKKVVLFSFPHVEGDTSPEHPATGRLDGTPNSAHARTRLEEEKLLMAETGFQKVILRCGMVYGKGILMIDAAHWFSKHYLLGIWKEPNYIHLISTADYVAATKAAILSPTASGIYHLGDEGVQTLKEFLDEATKEWHTHRPWVMPMWMIRTAAWVFEKVSLLTGWRAPLTQDFITIGKVPYYGDTSRMREELLPELKYPTFREGIHTL
jgi:nucleoside-diphosphate-sugar epimerase